MPADSIVAPVSDTMSTSNLPGITNSVVVTDPSSGNEAQQFLLSQFGYINLDYYYHQDLPKTKIYVQVPSGITYTNSVCYLAFPEINSVAELKEYNLASHQFGILYYEIPIGLEGKVVLISKQGSKYYSVIKPFTVSENLVIPVTPSETSLDAFKAALRLL